MINIYIPKNYCFLYFDFIIFSLALLLLIDKIICYIFRSSDNLIKLFGVHEEHEFSYGTILFLLIVGILPKIIGY